MILICFGTRPEWLKIKPLISLMNKSQYKLLFTGQHEDLIKNINVDYKIFINQSDNRLDQLIADCLQQFPTDSFNSVLVQGDTASAFACAVAAFNRKLKIYYLEAGLRSYSLEHPYPEEAYRQMITRVSNVNFAPTTLSESNIKKELAVGRTYVVGNTVLDNLLFYKDACAYEEKVLITLHRRENHESIAEWFTELEKLAADNNQLEFLLPMHPNPNVQKHKHLLKKVNVIEPLEHTDLLDVLVKCKLIITDSGGLQEESSFFNKKVIVCRTTTERPEAIQTGHLHLCESPKKLKKLFDTLINDYYIDKVCPYGDGHSSKRVLTILQNEGF